ncbi:bifunctional metallophosphatase/5'-nucleotidase [Agarivorans sp. Toyoura001]|uniref:bifunctional metallophosphatase/5'-nucleotidase n=1 Tax=Agarivorans sp. Toyoura001 TaxID=2283141 RepID=UPI0010F2AA42|nr:5'-nucleotidase C-terminal domain-containing protein [Agarivorans sp. Toyoura001]GDY24263.1 bifunctional metallophosphatase/5'-nucleotidase [Agarivorans sp. Toyoura001]
MLIKTKLSLATAAILTLSACDNDNNIQAEPFQLTIAHINDTHSNFDPRSLDFVNADLSTESSNFDVRTSVGGYPRLATQLKAARAAAAESGMPFLALHGGDAFQGSLYFNLLKGEGNARLLSQMGLDAMAVGNHEFDLGNDALIAFLEDVNFPVLAANMDVSADPSLANQTNLQPYVVKEFNGVRVGIFGLVLEDMPTISSPGELLTFESEVSSAQATVDALHADGVNNIIMVSHIGLDRDLRVANNVNGVDLIVGGHSHTLLGDFSNLGLGNGDANTDYAELITNPDGQSKTCVVQAGEYAQAVGQVTVSFSANGEVINCEGRNTLLIGSDFLHEYIEDAGRIALSSEDQTATENFVGKQNNIAVTTEDLTVRTIIDTDYLPQVAAFQGQVIGTINDANDPVDTQQLDHVRIPGKNRGGASLAGTGSEAGVHVATSMVWKLNNAGYKVDMAITNTGGVRDHIIVEQGNSGVTAGYIMGSLLYFSNQLAVVELKGLDVKDLLETAIDYARTTSSGAFPTFANLQFTYNGTAAEGNRLESLQVCPGGVEAGNCANIEDETVYRIATNAYIAAGRDGYSIFSERAQSATVNSGFVDNEVMIEYIQHLTTEGKALVELATGLTYIPVAGDSIDAPLLKTQDNLNL